MEVGMTVSCSGDNEKSTTILGYEGLDEARTDRDRIQLRYVLTSSKSIVEEITSWKFQKEMKQEIRV